MNVFHCSLEDFFRLCAQTRLDATVENTGSRIDHLPDAVGFAVHPGRGCEAATFGLAWVPHCHTTLVRLLDVAIQLGFEVTVRDETHYWETRDTNRLVAEVHEMNRIVARIAGALHDAIGDKAQTEGAIFNHPRFEQLESEPRKGSGGIPPRHAPRAH